MEDKFRGPTLGPHGTVCFVYRSSVRPLDPVRGAIALPIRFVQESAGGVARNLWVGSRTPKWWAAQYRPDSGWALSVPDPAAVATAPCV